MLSPAAKKRCDVETLLSRAGLLVHGRRYGESYSEIEPIKPSVKRARLCGVVRDDAALKILKEYALTEFTRVKRAVTAAKRLRHPGVVPVECAFFESELGVVVVQSPCYSGGNMREWCKRHQSEEAREARLRVAQRVAEAVRFLHAHGMLHRDLKPENVVLDREGLAAVPALCDFDLSIGMQETMQSTLMRGARTIACLCVVLIALLNTQYPVNQ